MLIGLDVSGIVALHPVSPRLRANKIQYNKPIGRSVELTTGTTVLPGTGSETTLWWEPVAEWQRR